MKVVRSPGALRRWRKSAAAPVILVPTMGALHSGHEVLVRRARRLAGKAGCVVVSVFVNPTQFGPKEDFTNYPRTLAADRALCQRAGADLIFAPPAAAMYAPDHSAWIDEEKLSAGLCGASRPGHFRGVCTVVAKLFHLVQPDQAVFGEKDWQQLAIIRRMVRDLNFPVRIVGVATVRERDGLAMSSRNRYLTPAEREVAARIPAALRRAATDAGAGASVARLAAREIRRNVPGARVDYVEAFDAETLEPLQDRRRPGRLASAVFLGKARLIDNVPLPERRSPRP